MQLTMLKGYPDYIGKRKAFCAYGSGPVSYPNTGTTIGDPVIFPTYGNYIDSIASSGVLTTDGTYIVFFQPQAVGARQTWIARWFAFTNTGVGSEATNGTNLSSKNLQVSGLCGQY